MSQTDGADTYRRIRAALLERQQVIATYNGHRRELCPHALGLRRGERVGYFYQFGGTSSSGAIAPDSPEGWRSMVIDRLADVTIHRGRWFTAPNYAPPADFDALDVDVPPDIGTARAVASRGPRLVKELTREQRVRADVEYVDIGGHRWTVARQRCAACGDEPHDTFCSEEVELYYCSVHEQLDKIAVTSETRRRAVIDKRSYNAGHRTESFVLVPTALPRPERRELIERVLAGRGDD